MKNLRRQLDGFLIAVLAIVILTLNPPIIISWFLVLLFFVGCYFISITIENEKFILKMLNKIFQYERIAGLDDADYLDRWTLIPLPGRRRIYLHHFLGSDWRDLHDHPKIFWSIGIRGGYIEQVPSGRKRWIAPWIRRFDQNHIHRLRINPKRGAWTIIMTGPASEEWGFYPDGKWIRWDRYMALKKELNGMSVSEAVRQGIADDKWFIPRDEKPGRRKKEILNEKICDYGCGKSANYQMISGKFSCKKSAHQCPGYKKKLYVENIL